MLMTRVIPVLLLRGQGLVKTVKFRDATYVGDPLNTVRLFNDKEVDELICLDIDASREGRGPNFKMLEDLASECFMPFGFGGGVSTLDQAKQIFATGAEKIVLNSHGLRNPNLIHDIATVFGDQAVIASIDVKRTLFGNYEVMTHGGTQKLKNSLADTLKDARNAGAGEILLNSIDRDGMRQGYDLALIRSAADQIDVPLIACGGAGSLEDLAAAVNDGRADAVAAGSLFVFRGKHRAVLVTYPDQAALQLLFQDVSKQGPTAS